MMITAEGVALPAHRHSGDWSAFLVSLDRWSNLLLMIMIIKFYYNLRVRQGISKQGLSCHLHKRGQLVDDLGEA